MATQALNIGLPLSYANRQAGAVHVRLHLTDLPDAVRVAGGSPNDGRPGDGRPEDGHRTLTVRVRGPRGAIVEAPGTVETAPAGAMVDASLPGNQLSAGTWPITVRVAPNQRFLNTDARVLVADPNPIALLLGPIPDSAVPPPRRTRTTPQKVAHAGGLLLDHALLVLPPAAAHRTRGTVRRVARRVLP